MFALLDCEPLHNRHCLLFVFGVSDPVGELQHIMQLKTPSQIVSISQKV